MSSSKLYLFCLFSNSLPHIFGRRLSRRPCRDHTKDCLPVASGSRNCLDHNKYFHIFDWLRLIETDWQWYCNLTFSVYDLWLMQFHSQPISVNSVVWLHSALLQSFGWSFCPPRWHWGLFFGSGWWALALYFAVTCFSTFYLHTDTTWSEFKILNFVHIRPTWRIVVG